MKSRVSNLLGATCWLVALASIGRSQALERVSVTSTGGEPDHSCLRPVLSSDGSVVAFFSRATNLVPGDTNGTDDVFVRDRVAQTTTRVSIGNAGEQSTQQTLNAVFLSDDGRFVLFDASGLDPADTDPQPDVYLRDRTLGQTTWLSTSTAFTHHLPLGISADGRVVAFSGSSPNQGGELRVVDRVSGLVRTLANTPPAPGIDAVLLSGGVLSGDGRFLDFKREIYFASGDYAGTIERLDIVAGTLAVLVPEVYFELPQQSNFDGRFLLYTEYGVGVLSGSTGLFRLDTLSGERLRIDVHQTAPPPFGPWWSGAYQGAMSADGAHIAFTSDDDGIVPGDSNFWRNAFVRILAQRGAIRVDLDAAGLDTDFETEWVSMTADASAVAFSTAADNLLPGDTNLWEDVYLRGACGPHYPDLDLDGFGDSGAASVAQCLPAPAGWSVNALDCDDTAANVHAFAFDGCDGVDNDCDGTTDEDSAGTSYCALNFSGDLACATTIGASGCLTLSATSGYVVSASNLPPQRPGLFFYGLQSNWASWGGAGNILCVFGPRQRLPVSSTGGAGTCGGSLAIDLAAWIAANPAALGAPFAGGEQLFIQGWYRDFTAPLGTSLTSAWTVAVSP